MPVLSIDAVRAVEAADFARFVLVPDLDDAARTVERAAVRADLRRTAQPVLDTVADSLRTLLETADLLDGFTRAATDADRAWFGGAPASSIGARIATEAVDAALGDVAAIWHGGVDGFPYGRVAAGGIRVLRTATLLRRGGGPVPVFNNGWAGRTLANGLTRIPATASAGRWLGSGPATMVFRTLGAAGAAYSTVTGVHELVQQGNIRDAFEREGAGYVADVAGTAFSASTTAFLIAPTPLTAGLVVATGIVWIGAEVWDAWGDDISVWVGDRVDDLADAAHAAWDVASEGWVTAADTATGLAGDLWDSGSGVVSGIGGAIGGFFP